MYASEMNPLSPENVSSKTPRKKSPRRVAIMLLIALVVCGGLPTWLILALRAAREDSRCAMCNIYLTQLALGLRGFDGSQGGLPPIWLRDEAGTPIHSWQSLVKPYLGYYTWEKAYSMKEPWNGPKNRRFLSCRDHMFQCPTIDGKRGAIVDYVAVVGPDTMWPEEGRVCLPGKNEPGRDAILLIEMPDSDYNSLEPRSPTVDEFLAKIKSPTGKGIRCIHRDGLAYVTAGGCVRCFPPETDPETIRQLFKRDPSCRVAPRDKPLPILQGWGEHEDR